MGGAHSFFETKLVYDGGMFLVNPCAELCNSKNNLCMDEISKILGAAEKICKKLEVWDSDCESSGYAFSLKRMTKDSFPLHEHNVRLARQDVMQRGGFQLEVVNDLYYCLVTKVSRAEEGGFRPECPDERTKKFCKQHCNGFELKENWTSWYLKNPCFWV